MIHERILNHRIYSNIYNTVMSVFEWQHNIIHPSVLRFNDKTLTTVVYKIRNLRLLSFRGSLGQGSATGGPQSKPRLRKENKWTAKNNFLSCWVFIIELFTLNCDFNTNINRYIYYL